MHRRFVSDPPIARFTATPLSGPAPLKVSFDATASYDPDRAWSEYEQIVIYTWSFGDGSSESGFDATVYHTFNTPGTFTVRLTVTDIRNDSSYTERTIIVVAPSPPNHVVTFPDPNLERVIREHINKPYGPILRSDLIALTHLEAVEENIFNLTGMEYLTNLTELGLLVNQISDITPLAGLTNLTHLVLWENQISDITPLARLINLTELGLWGSQISDIRPLAGLINLTRLWLWHNQIRDLAPLVANTGLGAGDWVVLGGNPLDLTPGSQNMLDIEELRRRGVTVHIYPSEQAVAADSSGRQVVG